MLHTAEPGGVVIASRQTRRQGHYIHGTRRLVELITIGAVSVGSGLRAVHIRGGGGEYTVDVFCTH